MSGDAVHSRADTAEALRALSPAKRALLEQKMAERRAVQGEARIERRGVGEVAPLTPAQRMLWLFDRVSSAATAYNMPEIVRLRGSLDAAALSGALDLLVARHEPLRTVVGEREGEPVQIVRDPVAVPLPVHDLRAMSRVERDERASALVRAVVERRFDLTGDLLLRAALIRVEDNEHVLVLVTHHIASDGASRGIVFRELGAAYAALHRGETPSLPPLPIQFADHALLLERELGSPRMRASLEYWTSQLDGELPVLDLPTDRPRPAEGSGAGSIVRRLLPVALLEEARRFARASGATPFMVLLAAWQATLARHAGQDEIVVGTPVATRSRPELDGMVGLLLNTLPLRTSFADDPTFAQVVARVRETVLGAFEHQDLPMELVAQARAASRTAGASNALFRVLFSLRSHANAPLALEGLEVAAEPATRMPARLDFTLSAVERADGLLLALEYAVELFDEDTVTRLLDHFEVLLRAGIASPDSAVATLPIATAEERTALAAWNATTVDYPALARGDTLVSLLEAQLRRTPEAVALRVDDPAATVLTYAALHARARRLAGRLQALGLEPGARVAVSLERSADMVVALLGVLYAGGAYVPIDPEYPAERIRYMLDDARSTIVLTHGATHAPLAALAARAGVMTVRLDDDDAEAHIDPALPRLSADAPAYMIYTSGSTGGPKGAVNSHRGIVNRLVWAQDQHALTEADVVLQKTPFGFDVSVPEFFSPLISGATLVVARPGGHRDPDYLASAIARFGVTALHFVPSMLRAFLDGLPADRIQSLTTIRRVTCSGEALPADLVRLAYDRLPRGVTIHNLYGPTECAVEVTHWTCARSDRSASVPIGMPVANTQCYVLNARGVEQPVGVTGELYIGGVQVGIGYHDRAELSAERFVQHPALGRLYRTGDVVRRRIDGAIDYLGRTDFQIKLRGFRIELGEIESALSREAHVASAVVVARTDLPGLGGDPALVAYVTPAPPATCAELDEQRLKEGLRDSLPEHMVPARIVPLDTLPISPNGKLDRRALPAPSASNAKATVLPEDDVERVVAGVWSEVLGLPEVDVESSFFELGGHSLLAIRILTHLSKVFRVAVPLRAFFDGPSVRQIARSLVSLEAKPGQTSAIATALLTLRAMSPEERASLKRRRDDSSQTQEHR